jgi:hypothetical protein
MMDFASWNELLCGSTEGIELGGLRMTVVGDRVTAYQSLPKSIVLLGRGMKEHASFHWYCPDQIQFP